MTGGTRKMTAYSVGQVSELVGVTVRTLHHYDEIGLLVPGDRSPAGYRLYTEEDLRRLARIVVYRRLELSLEDIAALLIDDDPVSHLRRQRETLTTRLAELQALVAAIDTALEKEMNDQPLSPAELKALFGDGFSEERQQEAEQRWGDTDAWTESARRTKGYTASDWEAMKGEMEAAGVAMVAALRSGQPATSEAAMNAAEQARRQIDRWFYPCSHEFHRSLGEMYVADPRFTKTYEDQAEGLAQYTRDAIVANAERHRPL